MYRQFAFLFVLNNRVFYETFEKRPILIQFKAGDNFNHRRPAGSNLGVNTLSISRIKYLSPTLKWDKRGFLQRSLYPMVLIATIYPVYSPVSRENLVYPFFVFIKLSSQAVFSWTGNKIR
jgi:hypothetical protein